MTRRLKSPLGSKLPRPFLKFMRSTISWTTGHELETRHPARSQNIFARCSQGSKEAGIKRLGQFPLGLRRATKASLTTSVVEGFAVITTF